MQQSQLQWIPLTQNEQLDSIVDLSHTKAQIIFKHSLTCSISSMIKNRLERAGSLPEADFYYLDLLTYRALSDRVAHLFGIEHESPQVLLIKDGACIYHESHYGIMMDELQQQIEAISK